MILNRKTAKKTSRISLFVALTMLTAVFATLQTQGFPTDYLVDNGVQVCKVGFIDLFTKILF